MYFNSRSAAGQKLADELKNYRFDDTAVLALSDGGVVVGAQIAARLHCPLLFLLLRDIKLPGESSVLGVIDQNGGFTYNDLFSAGELEELSGEYHTYIESQKIEKTSDLHRLLSDGGIVNGDILKDRVVIVVSDGLSSGMSLLAAMSILKPIRSKKIIMATPLASIAAVDKMHVLADELHVLSVFDGNFELDHYYEQNDVPAQNDIIQILNQAILQWQ